MSDASSHVSHYVVEEALNKLQLKVTSHVTFKCTKKNLNTYLVSRDKFCPRKPINENDKIPNSIIVTYEENEQFRIFISTNEE